MSSKAPAIGKLHVPNDESSDEEEDEWLLSCGLERCGSHNATEKRWAGHVFAPCHCWTMNLNFFSYQDSNSVYSTGSITLICGWVGACIIASFRQAAVKWKNPSSVLSTWFEGTVLGVTAADRFGQRGFNKILRFKSRLCYSI